MSGSPGKQRDGSKQNQHAVSEIVIATINKSVLFWFGQYSDNILRFMFKYCSLSNDYKPLLVYIAGVSDMKNRKSTHINFK